MSRTKIAVIGTGKTGSEAGALLGEQAELFNSKNKPTAKALKNCRAAIVFVPGNAVPEILDELLEAEIPAAWGSTGFDWPEDLHEKLLNKDITWVHASNFSLGMNLVRKAIRTLSEGAEALKGASFHIHEIHHTHKKDAPSGTALSWAEWLDREAEITSERTGDVKGIHRLKIETPLENITLEHKAKDRALFAEGAVWAAKQLIQNDNLPKGLMDFSTLFDLITD